MEFAFSYYALPLVLSGLISIVVAIYAGLRRTVPSALPLALLSLSIAEWSLAYALEIAGVELATKFFWGKVQYIGIATAPFFLLYFALVHARSSAVKFLPYLALVPGVTVFLALTMESHSLLWGPVEMIRGDGFSTLGILSRGFWFYVHFVYSYLLLLAGTIVLMLWMRRVQGVYRSQAFAIIFALVAPWAGNILYFSGVNPDPTPFAFMFTLVGLLWAIFGFRLVDVAPLARDMIVEGLREGLIVLDMKGNVVDINAAAARLIGLEASQAIGKPVLEVLQPWQTLAQSFRNVLEADETIEIGEGEVRRQINVRINPLRDRQKNIVGRMVTFWEISAEPARPAIRLQEPLTEPLDSHQEPPVPQPARQNSIWQAIQMFFAPPVIQITTGKNENLIWKQTIERSFTIIMRAIAPMGSLALLTFIFVSSQNFKTLTSRLLDTFVLIQVVIFIIIWLLALIRSLPFGLRVWVFLFLIYLLTFNEVLNYGYSAEGFAFLMAFVAMAGLLSNWKGSFWALAIGLTTMSAFGLLFGAQIMRPLSDSAARPNSISEAIPGLVALAASAIGMMAAVNTLMSSLNRSWQQEIQTRNLLQQERDLLEQRVVTRTQALVEARDQAVQSRNELRKYFRALEQSGNTVVITNKAGTIEYVNPHFSLLTGYASEEAIGQNPRILKSGTHSDYFYERMWQIISSGEIWRGEIHNRRKDGTFFWEAATIAPVFNEVGAITNYVAIKEDITDKKELLEQLENQNEYLSILQQMTVDLLNRQNLADLLHAVVDRACALLDAPLGEIMLKEGDYMVVRAFTSNQPYLLGDKVDRTQARLTWQAHDTGKPVILDDYMTWSGHREIYGSTPLHAVADFPIMVADECIGVLALGRVRTGYPFSPAQVEIGTQFSRMVALVLDNANLYDSALKELEQRKLAEEQKQRFLEDMKSLQEISLTLSQVESLDNLYVQMIDITQRRLGLDRVGLFIIDEDGTELMGTFGVDPSGMVRDERYYREPLTSDHWTLEILNAHNHAILWTDSPLFDDGQVVGHGWKVATALWNGFQPIGYMVCDTFLTRKQPRPYEVELISLLGSTFGHLIERKRAEQLLAIARDQALDASRFKSQLLAKVSHELRTPLGSVIGYAELLETNVLGEITDEQRDAVTNIIESGQYLNMMINELLDQAQIEAKSITIQNSFFAPQDLLDQLQVTMSILARKKNLTFETSLSPDVPPTLYGDSKRIQQVLINLTGNAIKFTIAGGVRVDIFTPDAEHWALRVADTGAGIPKEAQTYIFEPFRQVNNSITNYNRGTGLGLSITRQLVEMMGGRIELESEPGKGSVFTIILPIQHGD